MSRRYYKCPGLCKRPSTLCLPVTCQPDPAYPRVRKEPHYEYVSKNTLKRTDTRVIDSEGDVNSRLNDLENLLTKFDDDEEEDNEENALENVDIGSVNELSKILKPKVFNPKLPFEKQEADVNRYFI